MTSWLKNTKITTDTKYFLFQNITLNVIHHHAFFVPPSPSWLKKHQDHQGHQVLFIPKQRLKHHSSPCILCAFESFVVKKHNGHKGHQVLFIPKQHFKRHSSQCILCTSVSLVVKNTHINLTKALKV